MILAGMQACPARFPGGDDAERALWEHRERLLQYVGMTRARDWCALSRVDPTRPARGSRRAP
ncbi:hypothetical protein L6R52_20255 [Myxococcota bacterium]|nr:hypothetical protein [Myxococcota bacterium]